MRLVCCDENDISDISDYANEHSLKLRLEDVLFVIVKRLDE